MLTRKALNDGGLGETDASSLDEDELTKAY